MNKIINLHKMYTSLDNQNTAKYILGDINVNNLIGKNLKIEFLNEINCVACGIKTKKSYSQGHCYLCMRRLPQCDICIVKPELCHYDNGTCRDSKWGEENCLKPHVVYLSNTSTIKVGITKLKNIPSRWIDQGATQALPIFAVKTRLLSGYIETILKQNIADKTNWRKMLQSKPENIDLKKIRNELLKLSKTELDKLINNYKNNEIEILDSEIVNINFDVQQYPIKIKSFNLDKNPIAKGILKGIKGQYLIFDNDVINIRKFSGYKCKICIES